MLPNNDLESKQDFYQTLETSANEKFQQLIDAGKIKDNELRKFFFSQIIRIRDHYQQLGQSIGNLTDYIQCVKLINDELNTYRETAWGYTSLIPLAASYIKDKILGGDPQLPGNFGKAIKLAKSHNQVDPDGKLPLFQITCDAEKDFVRLIVKYLDFCVLSKTKKIKFDQNSIQIGKALPSAEKLIRKRIVKFNDRIQRYERSKQVNNHAVENNNLNPLVPAPSVMRAPKDIAPIIRIIDRYIEMQSRFNLYGKNRAKELKQDLLLAKQGNDLVEKKLESFIRDGKTESDRHFFSFFRSIRRKSGTGKNSLRGMLKDFQEGRENKNIPPGLSR